MPTQPPSPFADPTDPAAVRAWLAERGPNVVAVRAWSTRLHTHLGSTCSVPALGTPAWVDLADTDLRKLTAAAVPAAAQLAYWTRGAVADRLRGELDEFATAIRRALTDIAADVSLGWADGGYSVGPSHAELVRRRNTFRCRHCQTDSYGAFPCPHGCEERARQAQRDDAAAALVADRRSVA